MFGRSISGWLLPALFLFALALRLYGLQAPLLDTHSWRQADTAAIARNFVASRFDFLHPQVDWGGASAGYVESEFPLYTGMLAILYGMFGAHVWVGRLLSALASATTPLVLYALIRQQKPGQRDQPVALYAALGLCVLPFAIYFGRAVMPDALMLLTATLALWAFQRWLARPDIGRFLVAVSFGALAPLAKTPNLVILAVPLAYLVLAYRPLRLAPWLLLYGAAFALPVLGWTRYAATLPSDPRLSFGIGEKLFDSKLIADPQFYLLIGRWAAEHVLTWPGVVLAVVGLGTLVAQMPTVKAHDAAPARFRSGAYLPLAWLLGVLAFLLIGAAGVVGQDYYMLPLAVPGAWLLGAGLWQVQKWVARRWTTANIAVPVVGLAAIAALSVVRIAPMYQVADFYGLLGRRVDLALPAGQRVGVIAPAVSEIMYYGERKGWRLDPGVIVPGGLASLGPDLGVRYLVITDPWLSERRDLLVQELRAYRRVPVGPYALMLDLRRPGYAGDFELVWETGRVVEEPFLQTWRDLGGAETVGFPISDALNTADGRVQYFERVVLRLEGAAAQLAPAGRELLRERGHTPDAAPAEGAFAEAWRRYGGEATLGPPISPVVDRVQYFANGALEQHVDGTVSLAAAGRWLLDVRGLTEEQQIATHRQESALLP